jgi:hypothetical protein
MVRLVGGVAAFLGHFVRLVLVAFPILMYLVGVSLVLSGIWLFEERLAYIAAGLFLLWLVQPTVRRKT